MQVLSARHLVLACCCSLAVAAPAHAADWVDVGSPSTAPTGGDSQPVVAVEPGGDAVAAWIQDNGGGTDVFAATRPAGGTWGAPQKLTVSENNRYAVDPAIAMDADGNAILTWIRDYDSAGREQVQYATKPADGDVGSAQPLPGGGASGSFGSSPSVVFDADGNATAVFDYDPGIGQESRIRAVPKPKDQPWGAPADVTDGSTASFYSRAGIDDDGDITVVWSEGYFDDPQQVLSKTKPAGGGWPATVEDPGAPATTNLGTPELVVRPDGTAVATWTQYDAGGDASAQLAVRQSGTWTVTDITPDEGSYDQPALDVDQDGDVTLAARHVGDDPSTIVAARMPAASTALGDPETLSDGENTVYEPALDTASDGTVTVAWRDADAGLEREVVNASRLVAGAWTFPAHAAVAADDRGHFGTPFVAHDQHDNVLVLAPEGSDERANRTVLSVYDQVAPTLGGVTVPVTATSGASVTMTAAAADDWSPVLPHWGFGDVFKAGFSVEHAFAAGTHTVHVGAVDLAGNTSAIAERTITVTDPPKAATGGGTTTTPAPAPAPAPQQTQPPKPPAADPVAALVQQLLGGKPGTQLGDVRLGSALVYGAGDVPKGRVTFGSTSIPLLAFIAQRDTQLSAALSLQGVPAPAKTASAAATRTVKLKPQTLNLKAGQGGVIKVKLTPAQRKVVKRGKGKVRLVVTITARSGGTTTKATKKLRVSVK